MLKLLSLLFLFSLPLYAQTDIPKENKKLFKCLKRLGSSNRLDPKLMLSTVNSLNDIKSPADIPQAIETCRANVKLLKKNKRAKRVLVIGRYRELGVNIGHPRAYFLFQEFIEVTTECRLHGAKVIASPGVGIGVGTGFGKCQSSNGPTWMVSSVTLGAYLGFGAIAGVVIQDVDLWEGDGFIESDFSETTVYGAGATSTENDDQIYAIGLARRTYGFEADIVLKLIPTGNDYGELNQALLRLYD
jgi:hypothetical protein